jgi:WD40 repeat protein
MKFDFNIENIDIQGDLAVVGLSNLQGNDWNGGISLISTEKGTVLQDIRVETGITKACFTSSPETPNSLISCACDNGEILFYKLFCGDSTDQMTEETDNSSQVYSFHLVSKLNAHDDVVSTIVTDPYDTTGNRYLLLSAGWDSCIKVWDIETMQKIHSLPDSRSFSSSKSIYSLRNAHYSHVNDLSFASYHPSMIVSAGEDGFARIWDLRLPATHGCSQIIEHDSPVTCIHWAANSNDDFQHITSFYTGTMTGEVHYHDIRFIRPLHGRPQSGNHLHKRRVRKIKSISNDFINSLNHSNNREREEGKQEEESFLHYFLSTGDDHTIAISSFNSLLPTNENGFQLIHRFYINLSFYIFCSFNSFFCSSFFFCNKIRFSPHKESISDIHIYDSNLEDHSIVILSSSYDKSIQFTDFKFPF